MKRDAIFLISLKIGFKVQPRINVFLRQIIEDLVASGDLDLTSRYPSMERLGIPGDFRFVLIQRVFSRAFVYKAFERRILTMYEMLRHFSASTEKTLGLDTSTVTVETAPLIIRQSTGPRITRSNFS